MPTVISGATLSALSTVSWGVMSLFSNNEAGVWFDPSDMSTMFQDAAGTTPVTAVEQPVGLMLDKSKGLALGTELITPDANRDFSSDTGYWTKGTGTTISGGTANFSSASGYVLYRGGVLPAGTLGSYYEVTFTVSNYVSGSIRPYFGGTPTFGTAVSANGTYTQRFCPTSGTEFGFSANVAFTGSIDNVSVKQVLGNHASQSTSTSRPVLSARYNLLEKTEQFEDAFWFKTATLIGSNQAVAPDGTLTADNFYPNGSGTGREIYRPFSYISGVTYSLSLYVKTNGLSWITIGTNNASVGGCVWFNVTDGTVGNAASGYTGSSTFVGNGWYLLKVTFVGGAANTYGYVDICPSNGNGSTSVTANSTDGIFIWGVDLRVANIGVNLPPYQRVNTATDYDSNGFPAYLKFDGTDDFLVTNSISPGNVDKAQAFIGLRHLSNANYAGIVGLGPTIGDVGTFLLWIRSSAGGGYIDSYARGSTSSTTGNLVSNAAVFPPSTMTLSTLYDIAQSEAANEILLRKNGTIEASTWSLTAGTGNFASGVLTIGQYNNSNRFNGHLYNLIVRFSATNLETPLIQATEAYINSKTKAY